AKKLHEHFRRFGGITVAELNDIVFAILDPATPVRGVSAILDFVGSRDDVREEFPAQIQVQDAFHNFPLQARFGANLIVRPTPRRAILLVPKPSWSPFPACLVGSRVCGGCVLPSPAAWRERIPWPSSQSSRSREWFSAIHA